MLLHNDIVPGSSRVLLNYVETCILPHSWEQSPIKLPKFYPIKSQLPSIKSLIKSQFFSSWLQSNPITNHIILTPSYVIWFEGCNQIKSSIISCEFVSNPRENMAQESKAKNSLLFMFSQHSTHEIYPILHFFDD